MTGVTAGDKGLGRYTPGGLAHPAFYFLDDAGRRGKLLASRMSCATLRIFSAKGSRASFWRISSFITAAASGYAAAGYFPSGFGRAARPLLRNGRYVWD